MESKEFCENKLRRMTIDCLYYLGAGGRQQKHLLGGTVHQHMNEMKDLLDWVGPQEWLDEQELVWLGKAMANNPNVVLLHTDAKAKAWDFLPLEFVKKDGETDIDQYIGLLWFLIREHGLEGYDWTLSVGGKRFYVSNAAAEIILREERETFE